jgi:3-oxoacyl-[acyl-carrier protein] reductase
MAKEERTAIVTGASRGIGRAIAESQAAHGRNVVVNYGQNKESADRLVEQIEANGGHALAVAADVSKIADLQSLFQTTIDCFDRVDVLVNAAGILVNSPIDRVTEELFDRHFAINVKGTYFACQLAAKLMQPGGRIVNLSSSVLGRMLPAYSVYAATKGAVESFTRHLAPEFSAKQITINAVAPGPTDTDMLSPLSESQLDTIKRMTAFGRLGHPEDIAKVVLFLTSEESGWITGQTIRVNGGYT